MSRRPDAGRLKELLAGLIWSSKLVAHRRPLAEGVLEVMQHVINGQG
ncbi:protein of unknown function [Cyanobium sp. NIES-981]|nr:protein of unknown function [Cyanobium sp. NIES-981]